MITIDGSSGEGGGQVLRTGLALAAITGLPLHLYNIRAARPKPGLQAQHLTSVRAAAATCDAKLEGAVLGSTSLRFEPMHPPRAGEYIFDVTEARRSGSAGATTLVLQTVLLPLALAPDGGESRVTIRGGTHAPFSPPFPYLRHVYLPTLWQMGVHAQVELLRYGWYPAGGGELQVRIQAQPGRLASITLTERGELLKLWGIAAVSNLPSHIAQRMASRAVNVLKDLNVESRIEAVHIEATGPGAGIFLFAEYEHSRGGFTAYGRKGLPSEQVAGMACNDLLAHSATGAATDMHLADQLILPAAFAEGPSRWTTCRVTQHLLTCAWVVRQFLDIPIDITGNAGEPGEVVVRGALTADPSSLTTDYYHV
jgi:RNA 3'-terminal phosphate cyclase (ATP)